MGKWSTQVPGLHICRVRGGEVSIEVTVSVKVMVSADIMVLVKVIVSVEVMRLLGELMCQWRS
jgi:hypothetical protein